MLLKSALHKEDHIRLIPSQQQQQVRCVSIAREIELKTLKLCVFLVSITLLHYKVTAKLLKVL